MYHSQAEPQVASRVPLSLTGDDDAITATEQSLSAQIRDFSPQELGLQFPKPISGKPTDSPAPSEGIKGKYHHRNLVNERTRR